MLYQTRAGKKKFLTDPVKIIPFAGQSLRKDNTAKPRPTSTQRPVTSKPPLKSEPKVLSAPTGKTPKSSLSIKSLREQNEQKEQVGVDLSNMPMNDYDFDDIKMQWRQFAFKMKEEGKGTFYNALIKRDPIHKEGHQYILEVDNQVQVDYITPVLPDLLGFIRGNLKNYGVLISLEITKNPEEEVKFMSGKDKFAALARKNPNLHTLKNLFDLDIEY